VVYIDERCGAWQVGDDADGGPVEFRIFLPAGTDPRISAIAVGGSFQSLLGTADWDFAAGPALTRDDSDPRGTFWAVRTAALPPGFYEYQYQVTFVDGEQRVVTDPVARYGGLGVRSIDGVTTPNSGIVVGGSRPADNTVRPLAGGRKPYADLVVYELMIDDFTAEYRGARAPLDAVTDRLDDLAALGFTAIEFMPWTAWKNRDFDWGYEPFQYFAVEARYADDLEQPAEKLSWLKALVSACHDRGLHVIMDGVFNHVSFAFPYDQLYQDPGECPFTAGAFGGSFPGLQDLDFTNDCTNQLILEVCQYWIETVGLDGLRLDNTVNYYVAGDPRGLPDLISGLRGWLEAAGEQNFSFVLEHIDVTAAAVTDQVGATSFWDNSLYGSTFGALWNGTVDAGLPAALNNRQYLDAAAVPTLYLSNHDHSHVAWQAGARDDVGATGGWWRTQPFLIALFTSTAVPLVPNGQEFGEEHFLPEDDHNTGRRVTGRPLRWKLRSDPIGTALLALHGTLARLRRDHPGLRSANFWDAGFDAAGQTLAFHRWGPLDEGRTETFVVVLNFSASDRTITVPFPADGEWTDQLAGFDGSGTTWSVTVAGGSAGIPTGSHWGRVLYKIG
jgi:1,4-alpha-glucan branching enzyme